MIDFRSLMQESFPSFDSNSSFEGKFSRIAMCGGIVKGGIPIYVYMPPLTQRSARACVQSAEAYGKLKQTMKTSRGYAPPAGENSLRGVRYSLDRLK